MKPEIWTEERFPPDAGGLPAAALRKATQIANALRREGMEEAKSVRIAIACAANWWARQAPPRNPG
jgi:uncharacterized protein YdaT